MTRPIGHTDHVEDMLIPITRPELPSLEEYTDLLREVWSTRMLSNFSRFATELEHLTADYLGVGSRVVVSGDVGLVLAIASLNLPRGSIALVPSFTFNSTINAVLWNGLRPAFVDIDPGSFNVDPELVEAAATELRPSLIVATHVFGNPADADRLTAIAAEQGARLMFDAAHGYGSQRGSAAVGGFGDVEVFSLSGTKPVTSAEGGLVTSRNPELLDELALRRGYGFKYDYNTKVLGLNGKMSELHAALGLLTMRRIEGALAVRKKLVDRYIDQLASLPGVSFQRVRADDRSTYKDFAVVFESEDIRNAVEAALTAESIQTKRYFLPCHWMDAFRDHVDRQLPVTEDVYRRNLCLPLYESLETRALDRIVDIIGRTLRGD